MKHFPLCDACAYEYTHPETRRYDAQPVCCPDCGPTVCLKKPGDPTVLATHHAAIARTRELLASGHILAIKGIGGFHLACDAKNTQALAQLRARKQRPKKPFAVMVEDLERAKRYASFTQKACELACGWQKPILLLPKRDSDLSPLVAPDTPYLGLMLPYTPLHHLLFRYPDTCPMTDVLVMTSGNISGAPICHTDALVDQELSGICDYVLTHDRPINVRCDDSVVAIVENTSRVVRRSRGYAPLPILVDTQHKGCVLGIGSDLKNTFCLGADDLFYLSPHIGDLEDIRTMAALKDTLTRMEELLELSPSVVAADLHPKYYSHAFAKELGLPLLLVQHHFAHILSCMAENEKTEPVLGVAFDGTGYGSDGTIWGGELLAVSPTSFTRLGSIAPFLHPAGDIGAKEGWRIALSMMSQTMERDQCLQMAEAFGLADPTSLRLQYHSIERRLGTVSSTSAGRLFDAVSAILGFATQSSFEGEAAQALQFAAERAKHELFDPDQWKLAQTQSDRLFLPTDRLFATLCAQSMHEPDRAMRESLAKFFHEALVHMLGQALILLREQTHINTVALSGGVFQNALFATLLEKTLTDQGFVVLTHALVPANDGGLALGQAFYAMQANPSA